MNRWASVSAQGRALALWQMGVRLHTPWAELFSSPAESLWQFLLGLRPVLAIPPAAANRMEEIAQGLNFRLAAQIHLFGCGDQRVVVNTATTRLLLPGQPIDHTLLSRHPWLTSAGLRPISDDEHRILDGHPVHERLRMGTRPPLLILPTAGHPADTAAALAAHLPVIRQYGHRDLRLVVADDAPDARTALALERLVAEVNETYGVPVTRFAEWNGDGSEGGKQRFRRELLKAVAAGEGAARIVGPGLVGTTNSIFARFRDDLIWLEQDSRPYALERLGEGVPGSGIAHDVKAGPTRRHPVDIPHIVDRLFHASSVEALAVERQIASYEDSGFEIFEGDSSAGPASIRMVHFHTCGHPDFRARLGHHYVLNSSAGETTESYLSGGLPLERHFSTAPPTVSVNRWTSAFGTAVAFRNGAQADIPTMWATRIRLIDFSVGQILQARGAGGCVAGTALEHRRGKTTDSGRGELAAYVANEELLWPLFRRMEDIFSQITVNPDYPSWLRETSNRLILLEKCTIVPTELAHALWSELRYDVRRAESSADLAVRRYGTDLRRELGSVLDLSLGDYHRALDLTAQAELRNYAKQLQFWSEMAALKPLQNSSDNWQLNGEVE